MSESNTVRQLETQSLRIIFAGTPEFAASSLQALLDNAASRNYDIVATYTQPDRPSGRGQKLVASPVKALAQNHNIPVYQPVNFKSEEDRNALAELNADLMIVAAYGLILPKAVLETPRLGCINVHASLLPRWRGAAPIHRAVIEGDAETGITIMQMDVGLDTGDMLFKARCSIAESQTSGELHDQLAVLGGESLINALDQLDAGQLSGEKQDDADACYASKLVKQEGQMDWSFDANTLARKVLGLSPWPVAYTETSKGTMRIHSAHCVDGVSSSPEGEIIAVTNDAIHVSTGKGILALTVIQFSGGKRLTVKDALNGKYSDLLQVGQTISKGLSHDG
ncbi:methionyl-tRNA formyltransferase [Marinomonas sp. 2405UD68-3]|uniref:methionyl-tRNA formyltransferase n=1 Tax=Marinomonas sp. 2405UD68-3 TaxID=3391835 RepID=UPI0039C9DF2E